VTDPALADYLVRLNDQFEEGDSDAIERDATALARAVVHVEAALARWSVSDDLSPDLAADLLCDLRAIVRGVL
jgi:hypothetical protein